MDVRYRTFIRSFYVYRFFADFAFVYAVYIILFQRNGLSVLEISLLLSLWCAFFILFEIPTGALADTWNRKAMLGLGMVSKAVGFGCWLFARGFGLFALGFLFLGIQETFSSGTQEALLYDNLRYFQEEKDYERIAGRGHFYARLGIAMAVFLGGFMAAYSMNLVLVLSSISMMVGTIAILFFREIRYDGNSGGHVTYTRVLKDAFSLALRNTSILRLFLYSAVFLAVVGILDEYEQLYFHWAGLPIAFFGVIMVMRMGFEALGSRWAYRFERIVQSEKNIHGLSILSGLLLIVSLTVKTVLLIPVFALVFFLGAMGEVITEARLQRQIPSGQRATILSMNNFLLGGSAIGLTLLFGGLSRIGDLTWGFYAFALIIIVYSTVSLLKHKEQRTGENPHVKE